MLLDHFGARKRSDNTAGGNFSCSLVCLGTGFESSFKPKVHLDIHRMHLFYEEDASRTKLV